MITLAGLGNVVVVRRLSLLRSPGKETGRDSKGPRMRGRGGIPRAALCWAVWSSYFWCTCIEFTYNTIDVQQLERRFVC